MKSKISFVCQECGYDTPQWLGKCPECGSWNTLREFQTQSSQPKAGRPLAEKLKISKPKSLSEITTDETQRIPTGFSEMDIVLGGGIVPGSVILLAGDPGIGKSTLLLQVGLNIARGPVAPSSNPTSSKKSSTLRSAGFSAGARLDTSGRATPPSMLYISAEESEEQVKIRAKRLSQSKNHHLLLLSITDTDAIVEIVREVRPKLVIIDSIQTMESENLSGLSGSIGQVRYGAAQFIKLAKTLKIPIIMVGHVTKEGMVAGPMILSHMVDAVLFLEGEKATQTRILRGFKNRFGPIDEVGIFTMETDGLKEVKNPEQIFLTKKTKDAVGSVLTVILEGTRSFLIEIQALVVFSKMPIPRRVASGFDSRRLELLLAVLQKHCRLPLDTMDVFVNIAGGIKVIDPAADLALCLAIFSSLKNIPMGHLVGIAEVGLLGELRHVSLLEKRSKEARKLGFKHILSADTHNSIDRLLKTYS